MRGEERVIDKEMGRGDSRSGWIDERERSGRAERSRKRRR